MSNRVELNEQQAENILGGILVWEGGIVYPQNKPSCQYKYVNYTACQQWLVANWDKPQKEDCLKAMEAAGLVHKL